LKICPYFNEPLIILGPDDEDEKLLLPLLLDEEDGAPDAATAELDG
jgi:hypothetical protein